MKDKAKFTIVLDTELHSQFKVFVARNKTTMRTVLELFIRKLVDAERDSDGK